MKMLEMPMAKSLLVDYAINVDKEPVILTKNGKPVAALISIKNSDLETVRLSTNHIFQNIMSI